MEEFTNMKSNVLSFCEQSQQNNRNDAEEISNDNIKLGVSNTDSCQLPVIVVTDIIKNSKKTQKKDKTETSQKSAIKSLDKLNIQECTDEYKNNVINFENDINVLNKMCLSKQKPSILVKIDLNKLSKLNEILKLINDKNSFNKTIKQKKKLNLNKKKIEHLSKTYSLLSTEKQIKDKKQTDEKEIKTYSICNKNTFLNHKIMDYKRDIKRIKEIISQLETTKIQKKYIKKKSLFRTYFGNYSDISENEEDIAAIKQNKKIKKKMQSPIAHNAQEQCTQNTIAAQEKRDDHKRKKTPRKIHNSQEQGITGMKGETIMEEETNAQDTLQSLQETQDPCNKNIISTTDTLTEKNDSSNNTTLSEEISTKKSTKKTNKYVQSVEQTDQVLVISKNSPKYTKPTEYTENNPKSIQFMNTRSNLNEQLMKRSLRSLDKEKSINKHTSNCKIKIRSIEKLINPIANLNTSKNISGTFNSTSQFSFRPPNINNTTVHMSSITIPSSMPIKNFPTNYYENSTQIDLRIEKFDIEKLIRNIYKNFKYCRNFLSFIHEINNYKTEQVQIFIMSVVDIKTDLNNLKKLLPEINNIINYINQFMQLSQPISLEEYNEYLMYATKFCDVIQQHLNFSNPYHQVVTSSSNMSIESPASIINTQFMHSSFATNQSNVSRKNIMNFYSPANINTQQSFRNVPNSNFQQFFGNMNYVSLPSDKMLCATSSKPIKNVSKEKYSHNASRNASVDNIYASNLQTFQTNMKMPKNAAYSMISQNVPSGQQTQVLPILPQFIPQNNLMRSIIPIQDAFHNRQPSIMYETYPIFKNNLYQRHLMNLHPLNRPIQNLPANTPNTFVYPNNPPCSTLQSFLNRTDTNFDAHNVNQNCAIKTSSQKLIVSTQGMTSNTRFSVKNRTALSLAKCTKADPTDYDLYYKFNINFLTDIQKIILHQNLQYYMNTWQKNLSTQQKHEKLLYQVEKLLFFYISLDKYINKFIKSQFLSQRETNLEIQVLDSNNSLIDDSAKSKSMPVINEMMETQDKSSTSESITNLLTLETSILDANAKRKRCNKIQNIEISSQCTNTKKKHSIGASCENLKVKTSDNIIDNKNLNHLFDKLELFSSRNISNLPQGTLVDKANNRSLISNIKIENCTGIKISNNAKQHEISNITQWHNSKEDNIKSPCSSNMENQSEKIHILREIFTENLKNQYNIEKDVKNITSCITEKQLNPLYVLSVSNTNNVSESPSMNRLLTNVKNTKQVESANKLKPSLKTEETYDKGELNENRQQLCIHKVAKMNLELPRCDESVSSSENKKFKQIFEISNVTSNKHTKDLVELLSEKSNANIDSIDLSVTEYQDITNSNEQVLTTKKMQKVTVDIPEITKENSMQSTDNVSEEIMKKNIDTHSKIKLFNEQFKRIFNRNLQKSQIIAKLQNNNDFNADVDKCSPINTHYETADVLKIDNIRSIPLLLFEKMNNTNMEFEELELLIKEEDH